MGTNVRKLAYYGRLVCALSKRDLVSDVKDAWLGMAWIILQPVLLMLTFSIVRSIIKFNVDDIPYPLTSFTAICLWLMHTSIMQDATPSIERNAGIIKKMPVPRILFPLTGSLVGLVHYAVTWVPLCALMIYYDWSFTATLLYVPLLVGLCLALSMGIGLIIASFSIFKRDLVLALPYIIQLWFFLSPVIYPVSLVPEKYLWLYKLNPIVGLVEGMRNVVLKDLPPDWSLLAPTFVAIVIVWALALLIYPRFSRYFADVL